MVCTINNKSVSLGTGQSVSFWYHKWLPNGKTIREQIQGPLKEKEHTLKTSDVLLPNNILNLRISFVLPHEIIQLFNNTYRSPFKKDTVTWKTSPKGLFSTSSVYKLLVGQHQRNITNNFSWFWRLHCPNKIKFFLWLCQHNRIPTRNTSTL